MYRNLYKAAFLCYDKRKGERIRTKNNQQAVKPELP